MCMYNMKCEYMYEENAKKGDYWTPDDKQGHKCLLNGEWIEHACQKCPLPQSCEHWKERTILTDELDLCEYHSNELGFKMTSLCSSEHCPIVDEKYFETI